MNTSMAEGACERLFAPIVEALLDQPGRPSDTAGQRRHSAAWDSAPFIHRRAGGCPKPTALRHHAIKLIRCRCAASAPPAEDDRRRSRNEVRSYLKNDSAGTGYSMPTLLLSLREVTAELFMDAQRGHEPIYGLHEVSQRLIDVRYRFRELHHRVCAPVLNLATFDQHFDTHFQNCKCLTHILELNSPRHIWERQGGGLRHPTIKHIFLKDISRRDDSASYVGDAVVEKKKLVDELSKLCLGISCRKPPLLVGDSFLSTIRKKHSEERDDCRNPSPHSGESGPVQVAFFAPFKARNQILEFAQLQFPLWTGGHSATGMIPKGLAHG